MLRPIAKPNGNASLVRLPLVGLNNERAGVRAAVRQFRQWVETELLANGGGGIGAASRVNTCCVAMRRHLAAEDLLKRAGPPGSLGCTLSIDQWVAVADRSLKWKETVDRCLSALGLDVRTEPRGWYDRMMDEVQAEDRRRLQDRLAGPSTAADGSPAAAAGAPAVASDAEGQIGQGSVPDAATGQLDALPDTPVGERTAEGSK
jgi:hypothetical protein